MMWWYAGNGAWPWWGWMGAVFMIVFWGLLIWAAVTVFRYLTAPEREHTVPPGRAPTPEEILAERFARGEIDADEYQRRLAVLLGHPLGGAETSQSPGSDPGDVIGATPRERDWNR